MVWVWGGCVGVSGGGDGGGGGGDAGVGGPCLASSPVVFTCCASSTGHAAVGVCKRPLPAPVGRLPRKCPREPRLYTVSATVIVDADEDEGDALAPGPPTGLGSGAPGSQQASEHIIHKAAARAISLESVEC